MQPGGKQVVRKRFSRFSLEHLTLLAAVAVIAVGWRAPTTAYLSPQSGLGYALGIVGGSMMLVLLLYPLRKRFRVLRFIGTVPHWFRAHMILGVAGPVCILYHSNFSLGATNSNVALFCMLIVAGSGIVGRFLYSKIHHGLYGRKASLGELQARAEALKGHETVLPLLPELMARLEREEQRLLACGRGGAIALIAPFIIAWRAAGARRRIRRYVRAAVRAAATTSATLAAERPRVERVASEYAQRRIRASRQVAEFRVFEWLFSLWHVLHIPLFFMLLAAGIVHVIAVNVY
jgi:hypothetical protein